MGRYKLIKNYNEKTNVIDEVETQMQVLTKEEMDALKGGIGDIVIDPNGIVDQLKSDLSARISYLEDIFSTLQDGTLGVGSFNKSDLESTLNEYRTALEEINALEQATETYYFDYGSVAETYQQGSVVYSTIPYENQDPGLVGHELKHMYQFHNGEMDNYNIEHEMSAYRRQDIINNGANYFKDKMERKVEDIRKMLDEKGSLLYPNL